LRLRLFPRLSQPAYIIYRLDFHIKRRLTTMISKAKFNTVVGNIGAAMGILVFVAYIPQIIANIQGAKAQPWQPLFAAVSCLIWVLYGWSKEPRKDWILIIPNAVGVILGFLTFLTSL
jgi:integral membrane protein